MNPWDYLKPENPIAKAVAALLVGLFLAWFIMLAYRAARTLSYRKQLSSLGNVDGLAAALSKRFARVKPSEGEADAAPSGEEEALSVAADFFESQNVNGSSAVARHVKTIFIAGWNESRLDVGELIKHTTNELFDGNSMLRSVLATFIVLGLLGTLFGLADSLSQLSPLVQSESVSNRDLAKGLSELLGQLKSAFAPSILGVLFTVSGVLLFSAYLYLFASPTRGLLEHMTLVVWVPRLFPTTSQRVLETLQLSEMQMQRSFEAAQQVASFAEEIQGDVGELQANIGSANKTLTLLGKSSSHINDFADKFVEAVNHLAPFQQDLRALYEQIQRESLVFQSSVAARVKESEDFLEKAVGILNDQSRHLQAVLTSLDRYEQAYARERQDIDSTTEEVLASANKVFEDIGKRNQEVIEALGAPLREDLAKGLGDVDSTLSTRLDSIVQRFGAFDAPINEAARKIEGSLEAVVKRTETLTKELHGEFLKQNETNEKQLEQIGQFNEKIVALLSELAQSSKGRSEREESLGTSMNALATQVSQLTQSLSVRDGGMGGGGRDLETFVEGLMKHSADQARQIQGLAAEVKAIGGDLRAMRADGRSVSSIRNKGEVSTRDSGRAVGFDAYNDPDRRSKLQRFRAWLRRVTRRG